MSAGPEPAGLEGREEAGPAGMRFRIFKRGPWRRAFRLEGSFWSVLEQMARERGVKLADHVRELVETEGGSQANQSSRLRVHALEWLSGRLTTLSASQEPREVLHAALAAPLPCFVIGANRSLVSYNAEFTAYVTGRAQAASEDDVSRARLSLDVPIDRLIDVLASQPGRAVLCGFTIRTSLAIATGRAKVTLAQPSRRDMVVGYILPA